MKIVWVFLLTFSWKIFRNIEKTRRILNVWQERSYFFFYFILFFITTEGCFSCRSHKWQKWGMYKYNIYCIDCFMTTPGDGGRTNMYTKTKYKGAQNIIIGNIYTFFGCLMQKLMKAQIKLTYLFHTHWITYTFSGKYNYLNMSHAIKWNRMWCQWMPRVIGFRLVSAWLTADNGSMWSCWMSEIDSFCSSLLVFNLTAFKVLLFN